MNVALIGPSGSGKGTHAIRLGNEFNLVRVSTGDLFHDNVENRTALGLLARKYMSRGELAPDEVVDAMVEEWLQTVPAESGILFDGFPRTLEQAKFLDEVFRQQGRRLDAVVFLKASDHIATSRLAGRLVCSTCNAPYHAQFKPPAQPHICDVCGGELHHRPDDQPDLIRARLRNFHRVVGPVLEHYQAAGRVMIVDADGGAGDVYAALAEAIRMAGQVIPLAATREQIKALQPPPPVRLLPTEVTHPALDLVLLGGPGSGKGTQAEHLCREFHLPHISTGDLFRENLKHGTDLGRLAKSFMDRGDLVPDSVTEGMVEHRLAEPDTRNGFLLDGFPRTLAQAHALDEMLTRMGRRLTAAIAIEVSDAEIVQRLSARRICTVCQASYHLSFKAPKQTGKCDLCGGELGQRDDDNPSTIRSRLKTFHAQNQPLADYYQQHGVFVKVMGEGAPAEVSRKVIAAAKSFVPG